MSLQPSPPAEAESVYDSCNSGHSSFYSLASLEPQLQQAASSPPNAPDASDLIETSSVTLHRSHQISEQTANGPTLSTALPLWSDTATPLDSPFMQVAARSQQAQAQTGSQAQVASSQRSAADNPALHIQFGTLDSGIRALHNPKEGLGGIAAPQHSQSKPCLAVDIGAATGSDSDTAAVTKAPLTPEQSREAGRRSDFLNALNEHGAAHRDVPADEMPVLSSSPIPSSNGQHAVDAEQELLPPASAFSATPAASSPTYRCDDCGIFTTSPDLLTGHLRGRKHHKRLAATASGSVPPAGVLPAGVLHVADTLAASSSGRPLAGDTYCDVCEVITTSRDQLASHRLGKRHSRQVERLGSTDESSPAAGGVPAHAHAEDESCGDESAAAHALACALCDVALPDAQHAASHLKGQKHARRTRQEALLQDTEHAVTDALDSLLDDDDDDDNDDITSITEQHSRLAPAPLTQDFALHAAFSQDLIARRSYPAGSETSEAAADGEGEAADGGCQAAAGGDAAAESSDTAAEKEGRHTSTGAGSGDQGGVNFDDSPAAAPSAFSQGLETSSEGSTAAAEEEAAQQADAVAKVVRFDSPEGGDMLMGSSRVPPASPFPFPPPSEASSASPGDAHKAPARGLSPPLRPPPPLWRGASGVQPLHGGGSISVAAPHFCPVCGIIATSAANLQDHMRGRRHARRLQYLKHMPEQERSKHIERIASGDMLLRHGGGSSEGCLSSDMAAKLSSLNLPSSMDIARYLEQVQFVDLPEASPRKGLRTRLSQRLSTSSILLREPAIPEEGTLEESLAPLKEPAAPTQAPTDPTFALAEPSAEAGPEAAAEARTDQIGSGTEQGAGGQQEADELGEAGEEGSREVHHCPVCSISTTSAAHLEAHMAGRKHRRRAEVAEGRIARRSPHVCRLCDITTTSADHMALHIAGRAHQRRARAEAMGGLNGAVPISSQGSADEVNRAVHEHQGTTRDERGGAGQHVPASHAAASRSSLASGRPEAAQQQQPWRGNSWQQDHRPANGQHRGGPPNSHEYPPHPWSNSPYSSRPSSANSSRPAPPYSNSPAPPGAYPHPPHRSPVGARSSPQPPNGMPSPTGLPPYMGFFPSAPPFFPSPGVMPHHAFMSPGWWGAPTATHSSPSQPPQSSMLPPMLLPGGVMPAYAPLMAPGGFKEVPPGPSRGSHGSPAQLPGARGNPPHAVGPSDDAYNCEACQVQVNGIDRLRHHMRSKQHVKRSAASS